MTLLQILICTPYSSCASLVWRRDPRHYRTIDRECKKTALCKHPPIPHVPEKDSIQETVSVYKDNHLKTQIGHSCGIGPRSHQKKGYFKAYKENNEAYVELQGKIKTAKAELAKLDESAIREAGTVAANFKVMAYSELAPAEY